MVKQNFINVADIGKIPLNEHTKMLLKNLDGYLNQEVFMEKIAVCMCSIIHGDIIVFSDQSHFIVTEARTLYSVHAKGNFFIRGEHYCDSEWKEASGYANFKYWDLHFFG